MITRTAMSAAAALLFAVPAFAQDAGMGPPESCSLPGLTVLADPEGDAVLYPGLTPYPLAQKDLTEMSVSQMVNDDGETRIVFRMKVAGFDFDPVPQSSFYSSFVTPTNSLRGIRMNVDAEGAVTFFSYQPSGSLDTGDGGQTDGRFVESGTEVPADPASYYNADGEIVIIVDPIRVGLQFPGDQLTQFNAGSTTNANHPAAGGATFVDDEMPDGLSRRGSFTYLDAAVDCPADPNAPAAKMAVSHTSGNAPLTVQFDASESSAKDGSQLTYTFNFGDNSKEITSQVPYATHTYVKQGLYTAAVTVTDAQGREDYATTDIAAGVVPAAPRAASTSAGGALGWMLMALGAAGLARRRR